MIQSGTVLPIIKNSLNIYCQPTKHGADFTTGNSLNQAVIKNLIAALTSQSTATLGFNSTLPNVDPLWFYFDKLLAQLLAFKQQGFEVVVISKLQSLKLNGPSNDFNYNMNQMVQQLIDFATNHQLTIIMGIDIKTVNNIPAYALNKKANLWINEYSYDTWIIYNNKVRQVSYSVLAQSPYFAMNKDVEFMLDNREIIKQMKNEFNNLMNDIVITSQVNGSLNSLSQLLNKATKLSESMEHKYRQQVKLTDLYTSGFIESGDLLSIIDGDYSCSMEFKLIEGELVIVDSDGTIYKTPSGAAKSYFGRETNGWEVCNVKNKEHFSKGSLMGMREAIVNQQAVFCLTPIIPSISPKPKIKSMTIREMILEILKRLKFLNYDEIFKEIQKKYPGALGGKTPSYTVAGVLSLMVKNGEVKVATPENERNCYYL